MNCHRPEEPKYERVVRAVAARMKVRCWWADPDDMRQVGREAVVRALRTFDPRVGVPEEAYVASAVYKAVCAHLWRQSAPVTGGKPSDRKGLHRSPIEDLEGAPLLACASPSPEVLAAEKQWIEAVRQRLEALVSNDPEAAAGLKALLEERTPASDTDKTAKTSYRERGRARDAIRRDPTLWKMLRAHRKESP